MKQLLLRAPGELELSELPDVQCPEGGMLLKTLICAVCGTDIRMYRQGHRDLIYPRVPGHEIVGEVVENRSGADFCIGDVVQLYPGISCGECIPCLRGQENQCVDIRIIGFNYDGGFAEYVAVPPRSIIRGGVNRLPAGLRPEMVSLAEPLASCINAQEMCDLKTGETVLIIGGGSMGLLQAMLARYRGAAKILVSEPLPERQIVSEKAGIDRVIDPVRINLPAVIDEETGGFGVDVILVAWNGADIATALKLLAPRGRLCLFSGLGSQVAEVTINANLIHYKDLRIFGAYGSTAAQNTEAVRLIVSGEIDVSYIEPVAFRLEEFEKAVEFIENKQGMKALIRFY